MLDDLRTDPAPRERELSAGFMRQRRNLILASLLLLLFYAGEMTVERLNIFGSLIRIGEPRAVAAGVWLLFGYAFVRFVQYYREEGPAAETWPAFREAAFQAELSELKERARRKAEPLARRQAYFEQALNSPTLGLTREYIHDRIETKSSPLFRDIKIGVVVGDPEYEKRFVDPDRPGDLPSEEEVARLLEEWTNEEFLQKTERNGASFTTWIRVHLAKRLWLRVKGGIAFLIGRSNFTDYQLPGAFAAIAAALVATWVFT